jgi:hypothetical protein
MMVQEVRRIILSKDELISALDCHGRRTPNFIPAGKIAAIDPAGDHGIAIRVVAMADDYELSATLTMRDTRLLMPVIRYCIENNIWLPPQGRKSIEIRGGEVALCIEIDTDIDIDCPMSGPMRLPTPAMTRQAAQ